MIERIDVEFRYYRKQGLSFGFEFLHLHQVVDQHRNRVGFTQACAVEA